MTGYDTWLLHSAPAAGSSYELGSPAGESLPLPRVPAATYCPPPLIPLPPVLFLCLTVMTHTVTGIQWACSARPQPLAGTTLGPAAAAADHPAK